MDRFFGFDLGDAESAVSRLEKEAQTEPEVLAVDGQKSFITAYARTASGTLCIGEKACYLADAADRKIRFKSRFLDDPGAQEDVRRFAAGVLGELYGNAYLIENEDTCFYVGCPAGWNAQTRERYREIFQQVGYPPVRIVSESRAAMVSACQSRHLQVGYDLLSKPVLVVDIGSSTTDFAYIMGGKEVEIETAGEVKLGGGLMDERLLELSVENSGHAAELRKVFEESEPWHNYCEFRARRLKEKYFTDESYFEKNECLDPLEVRYTRRPLRLTLRMDKNVADQLLEQKLDSLNGRSFHSVFTQSLQNVKNRIHDNMPQFLFLTGGVCRLSRIRSWCQEVFPDAVIISSQEPEFSVSKGLAWSGRIDEELREFKDDLEQLKASDIVETIVTSHIDELYRSVVNTMVDPILENVAEPAFERWRSGQIARMEDIDGVIQKETIAYLHSQEAAKLLEKPIARWMKPVAAELEKYTLPICVKHHVPYTALSLSSYFSASDITVKVDTRDIFAVEEITLLMDSIISVLVGLLCGGGGIAAISSGPQGIVAGILASVLVLSLGKNKMEEGLMKLNIPRPLRRLVTKQAFSSRLQKESGTLKQSIYDHLVNEKNDEITERLADEISSQIEICLTKMAQVVEIPLG